MLSTQGIGVLSTKRGGVRSSRTAKAADEKTGWPKANGIFRGGLSSVASRSRRSVTPKSAEACGAAARP